MNVICVLLLILPYSATFDGQGEWINSYVIIDLELTIFILPLILFIFSLQIVKNQSFKKWLLVTAMVISGIYFFFTILSLLIPSPDFMPSFGVGLMVVLFPVLLINVISTFRKERT